MHEGFPSLISNRVVPFRHFSVIGQIKRNLEIVIRNEFDDDDFFLLFLSFIVESKMEIKMESALIKLAFITISVAGWLNG